MIYKIQINKRPRNIRVYEVLRKTGGQQNALTRIFLKMMNRKKKDENTV